MSTDRFDSPEEAARYGFPAECRIVAMRKQGDAAYVLLDTGPAGRPYLYGVNCQRRDGSWSPGASGNGPGCARVRHAKERGKQQAGRATMLPVAFPTVRIHEDYLILNADATGT